MSETPAPIHEWSIDASGHFHLAVRATDDSPAWSGVFYGGAGMSPAAVTPEDAAVVAWYGTVYESTVTARSLAEIRDAAWREWAAASENETDLARKAADPYEPELGPDPWWARGYERWATDPSRAGYAAERFRATTEE